MLMQRLAAGMALAAALTLSAAPALAHCQIPCGIYDDDARFTQIAEHIRTIEKSMQQIEALNAERKPNYNQIARWVLNKEKHADELAAIVTYYFMAQRVKPADPADAAATAAYQKKVVLLHQMLVAAMKAKQTNDTQHVKQLRELLGSFAAAYGSKWHGH